MSNRSVVVLLVLSISVFSFQNALAQVKEQSVAKPVAVQAPIIEQHKIDLNKATIAELTGSFKGIGKKRAEAIIVYREAHQGFKSIEELAEVKGLGARFVEKNREQLIALYSIL